MFPWRCLRTAFTSAALLMSAQSQGAIDNPVRNISEIQGKEERAHGLSTAKVLYVNYGLVKRDFPWTKAWSKQQIDSWITKEWVWVSDAQVKQTETNTTIAVDGRRRTVKRPLEGGRNFYIPVSNPNNAFQSYLVDGKGLGALNPKLGDHSNGLGYMVEFLREAFTEEVVNRSFSDPKFRSFLKSLGMPIDRNFNTVGTYAVVDLGFYTKSKWGNGPRAAAFFRQPVHRYSVRKPGDVRIMPTNLPRDRQRLYETALRMIGLTSSGGKMWGLTNVQGDMSGNMIDFGAVTALSKQKKGSSIYYYYTGGDHQGETVAITPDDPRYPKFIESLSVDNRAWGKIMPGVPETPATERLTLMLLWIEARYGNDHVKMKEKLNALYQAFVDKKFDPRRLPDVFKFIYERPTQLVLYIDNSAAAKFARRKPTSLKQIENTPVEIGLFHQTEPAILLGHRGRYGMFQSLWNVFLRATLLYKHARRFPSLEVKDQARGFGRADRNVAQNIERGVRKPKRMSRIVIDINDQNYKNLVDVLGTYEQNSLGRFSNNGKKMTMDILQALRVAGVSEAQISKWSSITTTAEGALEIVDMAKLTTELRNHNGELKLDAKKAPDTKGLATNWKSQYPRNGGHGCRAVEVGTRKAVSGSL